MSTPNAPKTLKQIHIPSYIREGGMVRGYRRLQEVRLPELDKQKSKIKYRDIDQLMDHAADLLKAGPNDEEGYYDGERFQREILGLYSDGMHGIFDPGFTREKDRLGKVYDDMENVFPQYDSDFGTDAAWKVLTDPDYLQELHEISLGLEDKILKKYGISTERVNPFVFRAKLNLTDEVPIGEMSWTGHQGIHSDFDEFQKAVMGDQARPEDFQNAKNSMDIIDALIRGTSIDRGKLEKTLIPATLMTQTFKPEFFYDPNIETHTDPSILEKNVTMIDKNLHLQMNSEFGLPEELRNYSAVLQDPDALIRKPFLKYLQNLPNDPRQKDFVDGNKEFLDMDSIEASRQHLMSQMKGLKADEIVPNFIYMMENKGTFKHATEDRFKKPFNKYVKAVTQKMFDTWNGRHDFMYFSNNPMDFVTMSPSASITSCQSISSGRDAYRDLNEYNVNMFNSLRLNESNDFIMYTLDSNSARRNLKTNRMSLHQDKDNDSFINYEQGRIYSRDGNKNQLSEYFGMNGDGHEMSKDIIKTREYIDDDVNENISGNALDDLRSEQEHKSSHSDRIYRSITDDVDNMSHEDFDSERDIEDYVYDKINEWDDEIGYIDDDDNYINESIDEAMYDIHSEVGSVLHGILKDEEGSGSYLYGAKFQQAITTLNQEEGISNIVENFDDGIRSDIMHYTNNIRDNRESLESYLEDQKRGVSDDQWDANNKSDEEDEDEDSKQYELEERRSKFNKKKKLEHIKV